MKNAIEMLASRLEEHGLKGRIVPIRHLRDLQNETESRRDQGFYNEEFYQEALSFFAFHPPDDLTTASSLIVIAVPRPKTRASFTLDGETVALTIPPTYSGFLEIPRRIEGLLTEWLSPIGHHVARALLPQKLLAVRSGLAEYGRNNISYISDMGSFYQLTSFYSDLPCEEDVWREPQAMDVCQDCGICSRKCPSGAIAPDRFLLRAERCIVFHNERSLDYPFPEWVDPAWHNCLVGCMLCQEFCPENKAFREQFGSSEAFSHEETSMLLEKTSVDRLPDMTQAKLARLQLIDPLYTMPRNLGVFFERPE